MNEFSQALSGMDPGELALGAGLLGAMATLIGVFGIVWFFVSALGYFKMFQKAGQRAWMAFIPLLRDYVRFKMSWNMKAFVIYIACFAVGQILEATGNPLLTLAALVFMIVALVHMVKLDIRLARSFGKGTGWGVLLLFFPFVVSLILGFGKAE